MSYGKRLLFLVILDSIIVSTAIFIATWIVYPMTVNLDMRVVTISAIALLFFHHLFASLYKLYHKVWSYASIGELLAIFQAVSFAIVATGIVQWLVNNFTIYHRGLIVTWMLHILFIGGSRFAWRVFRDRYITHKDQKQRTLVVGAGAAGAMVARQLTSEPNNTDIKIVAFIDDDPN